MEQNGTGFTKHIDTFLYINNNIYLCPGFDCDINHVIDPK